MLLQVLKGEELLSNSAELAKLRAAIFHEYPYLYDVDPVLEKAHLSLFAHSEKSLLIVAKMDNQIVGALTGMPLDDAQKEVKDAFVELGMKTEGYYCLCEIILLKNYRGQKIGSRLYKEFESQLSKINHYPNIVLWQIVKAPGDPKKPKDYFSLDPFWRKLGYVKHPELSCSVSWKEISEKKETPHRFEFWIKQVS